MTGSRGLGVVYQLVGWSERLQRWSEGLLKWSERSPSWSEGWLRWSESFADVVGEIA